MILELTSLIPLVGSLVENPIAVKHLDNGLYISTGVGRGFKNVEQKFEN